MQLHLEVEDERPGALPARSYDFQPGPLTMGRSVQNQLVLDGEMLSRVQASLAFDRGIWFLTHQGSVTPTELNGVSIPRGTPVPLSTGAVIRMAHWALRVALPSDEARTSAVGGGGDARTTMMPRLSPLQEESMLRAAPGPAGRTVPTLAGVGEGGVTYRLELREVDRPYVIGRSSGADLTIALGAISRRHAEVRFDGARVYVSDAGARNPVRVNDRPIAGETPLAPGDVVGLGPVDLRLLSEGPPPTSGFGETIPFEQGGTALWQAPPSSVPELEPIPSSANFGEVPSQVAAPSEPAAQWDQLAQQASTNTGWDQSPAATAPSAEPSAPNWASFGGGAVAPSAPTPAPAWDAPPPPAAPSWSPPPAPSPAAWVPPAPAMPAAPAWSPPVMPPPPAMAAPAMPAPPASPFAVAPLPAIPGPAIEVAAPGAAPAADPAATRVITRRASSQRGWLVAGIVCMAAAVLAGTLMLVIANA